MPSESKSLGSTLHSSSQLDELDTLSICLPSSASTIGSKIRTKLRGAAHWANDFDVVSLLGGEGQEGRGSGLGTYGHTGCINALDWSSDGTSLASGSDDTRACIWKLGQEPDSIFADNADVVQRYPALGTGLSAIIHTGHRANIFSVKFAPRTTNILFTASGDHEARVFDLNQAASGAQTFSSPSPSGGKTREWSEYTKTSGVCTRVLKCHRGRVKRIATEGVSDAVFLTCSEDGTVRQHDLRVGHVCKRDCPPPLCSYREKGMGLYSLTTTVLRPELFVVAGTSPFAYLHDRRMVPRTMMEEWGVPASPTELTQCVRRFGPARPPLVPEPDASSDDEDDDGRDSTPRTHAARIQRLRRRRARIRSGDDNHVTAAKLSKVNGRELLLTYSGGPICLYDIFDDPESSKKSEKSATFESQRKNGKRKADEEHIPEVRDQAAHPGERKSLSQTPKSPRITSSGVGTREPGQLVSTRKKLDLPEPREKSYAGPSVQQPVSDFTTSNLEDVHGLTRENGTEGENEEPVYKVATEDGESAAQEDTPEVQSRRERRERLRSSLRRSPSAPNREGSEEGSDQAGRMSNFEIRVGEDGNIEMEMMSDDNANSESGRSGEGVGPMPNAEERRLALESIMDSHEGVSEGSEDVEQSVDEDDDIDDDEVDSDDISSSDDPETAAGATPQTGPHREVPLIRPQKIYKGHRNVDTVKDVNFGGMDNLVVSGSDDGNVFIYDKETTEVIGIYKGDESVVNVMQYHPQLPIMAVSGIDNSAKVLAPTTLGSPEGKAYLKRKFSRLENKDEIMQKNQDPSWTSERLAMPPSVLINLLNRAAAAGDDGEDGDGEPGGRRRIPLSALLQLAGEGDTEEDCIIM